MTTDPLPRLDRDVLAELAERLQRARTELDKLARLATGTEADRLAGKREGVDLARSYALEYLRDDNLALVSSASPFPVVLREDPEDGHVWQRTLIGGEMDWTEQRDGLGWTRVPTPRRRHRCFPQTRAHMTSGITLERCPCGAIRSVGVHGWTERNSRRRDQRRARRRG